MGVKIEILEEINERINTKMFSKISDIQEKNPVNANIVIIDWINIIKVSMSREEWTE